MARIRNWGIGLGIGAALALLPGCATRKYVSGEVQKSSAASEKHISDVESQVEQTQTTVRTHESKIQELDQSTKDALNRATEAGKLAQGKFNYSVVLSDDKARFPTDRHELSTEAKSELDELVEHLKADDKNVYLEIQGHTDSRGTTDYNMRLG
jgi:outer membrane protein OmpA-like peptidoglycan-associated protein